MSTDPKLEQYLTKLDRALGSVPVSDRADIITEIRSHILDAMDRGEKLGTVLSSLGEPETVANRYLIERGLKPGKAPKSPILKWMTIGVLGTFGIFAVLTIVLAMKFSPLLYVDGDKGHVKILGGLIEVTEPEENGKRFLKIGNFELNEDFQAIETEGSHTVDLAKTPKLAVKFINGKFDVSASESNELKWKCQSAGIKNQDINIREQNGKLELNFDNTLGSKCDLELPAKLALELTGSNGKVKLNKPQGDTRVDLSNGKVSIKEDQKLSYRYKTDVKIGKVASFVSSDAKDAIFIDVKLSNGVIEN